MKYKITRGYGVNINPPDPRNVPAGWYEKIAEDFKSGTLNGEQMEFMDKGGYKIGGRSWREVYKEFLMKKTLRTGEHRKGQPMMNPPKKYDQVGAMMAYEEGSLTDSAFIKLFASLIKSGLCWSLQGSYGREAQRLIEGGYITKTGDITDAGKDFGDGVMNGNPYYAGHLKTGVPYSYEVFTSKKKPTLESHGKKYAFATGPKSSRAALIKHMSGWVLKNPVGLEWAGDISNCNLCGQEINDAFVDGKTIYGPWGIMCMPCHIVKGCGLGIGKGQKYMKNRKTGKFVQVASHKNPRYSYRDDITHETWMRYDLYQQTNGTINGQASTNDDNDDGYPDNDVAVWDVSYKNYDDMLKTTGGTHTGLYGQPVEVFLNGKAVPTREHKNPPLLSRRIFNSLLASIYIATVKGVKMGAPEGHLYAPLMGELSLDDFNAMIGLMLRNGLVTKSGHLIRSTEKLNDILKD